MVTFKDGTTPIGSGALTAGGVATLSTSVLTAGTHSITAAYGGDAAFQPSTSSAISQVISAGTTCSGNTATNASLVEHYYTAILRRPSDAGGKAFWMSEADRLCALGADPKETFVVMANVFFNTPEYLAFNRDDNGFVTDLYNTFFSRLPDAAGLSYWLGQLAAGMPRNNVMNSFLFSPEFTTTMNAAFPGQTARAETYLVLNLYGGLFRRLADTGGYTYWTGSSGPRSAMPIRQRRCRQRSTARAASSWPVPSTRRGRPATASTWWTCTTRCCSGVPIRPDITTRWAN